MAEFYDKSYLTPQQKFGGYRGIGGQKGFFGSKKMALLASGYKTTGEQTALGKATGWIPGLGIPMQFAAERVSRGTDVQKSIKENRKRTFAKAGAYYAFGVKTGLQGLSGGAIDTSGVGEGEDTDTDTDTDEDKKTTEDVDTSDIGGGTTTGGATATLSDYILENASSTIKDFNPNEYTALSQESSKGMRQYGGLARLGHGQY